MKDNVNLNILSFSLNLKDNVNFFWNVNMKESFILYKYYKILNIDQKWNNLSFLKDTSYSFILNE